MKPGTPRLTNKQVYFLLRAFIAALIFTAGLLTGIALCFFNH